MKSERISITDSKCIQVLLLFTMDVQTILIEKAVTDFFQNRNMFSILELLNSKGIILQTQPRKRISGRRNDRNDKTNRDTHNPPSSQHMTERQGELKLV